MTTNKDISGNKTHLSREDIRNYASTSDERVKHAIEMRSNESSFEQDAFEGWEEMNYDPSVMKRLDKKFSSSNFNLFNLSLVSITVVSVGIVIFMLINSSQKQENLLSNVEPEESNQLTEMTFTLDEEDVILDEAIEQMSEAKEPEQIKVHAMKQEQKSIDSFNLALKTSDSIPELIILPSEPLEEVHTPAPKKSKIKGKEVYLNDFKLIDYREYRSRPEIKTKQLVLSGTSADKENSMSEGQTSEWRDVEIPYIDYIDKTTSLLNRNNFKKVLDRSETILKTYPDDINALFYGGICLYNLKEYEQAIEYFSRVLNGEYLNFDEEALWLIANSFDKSGKKELARSKYKEIVLNGGFYAKQAADRLKK